MCNKMANIIYVRMENEYMQTVQKMIDGKVVEALSYYPHLNSVLRHVPTKESFDGGGYVIKCPVLDNQDCAWRSVDEILTKDLLLESTKENKFKALEQALRQQ